MLKLELAREDYATAEKVEPSNAVAPIKQGHVNSFLGRFEDARRDYDRGMKIGKPQTRFSLANFMAFVHLHADQPREALAELHVYVKEIDASELSPAEKNTAKIFMLSNMATIAFHIGDREEARKLVEGLSKIFEASAASVDAPAVERRFEADIRLWQGYLAAYEDQPEAALAHANAYRALLEADKNPRKEQRLHALLGVIELRQKRFEKAIEYYRLADLESDVYSKYQLASALKAAGQGEEAKRLFKEVAEWSFNSVSYALVRRAAAAER
jgi:tetratricopeptide (TPR) repeat protein